MPLYLGTPDRLLAFVARRKKLYNPSRSGGCGWGLIIISSVRHLDIMETDVTRSTYKISLNDLSL